MKKILLSTLLTLSLLSASTPIIASASDAVAPGQATSTAVLTADATLFSVTVPTSVLIYVDAAGEVYTPDNVQITNHSAGPIVVSSLAVTTQDGWTLDSATTDYSKAKVGRKNFSMTLNGLDPSGGALALDTPINGLNSLNLALFADVAPQKEAINGAQIAEMIVTVGWYSDDTDPETSDPEQTDPETPEATYPEGFTHATDSDFEGETDGWFTYVGTADYVVVPHTIKGIPITSYRSMFANTSVKGVISDNPNITSMELMFYNSSSDDLVLDLNTANVTNMSRMFEGSQATVLDLSSFDTAKVTTMQNMFKNSKAELLDLSNFSTTSVTTMLAMFYGSSATTIDLSSFNTDAVTTMQSMFYGAKALILDLSSFNTASVTTMNDMFQNSAATTINLSSFGTASVTSMGSMFEGSKAETLDLSGFMTSNVTTMLSMFKNSEAKAINFGSSFDTGKLISMRSMFEGSKVEALDLSGFNTTSTTDMQAMFKNSAATTINLSSFGTYQVTNFGSMFEGSKAEILDLSTFSLGYPTPNTINMFLNATSTTGYAKNAGLASQFNTSMGKPAGLTFTVK